jgi:hypothetical protein
MPTQTPQKPKRPKLKATERTLKALRARGYHAEVCERFVAFAGGEQAKKFAGGFRKDLFGYMDIVAYWDTSRRDVVMPDAATVGSWAIQSTSKASMSNHLKDYRRNPAVAQKIRDWLARGNRFSLVGWDYVMVPKVKGNGFKGVWKIHEEPVDASMLEPNAADLVAIAETEKEAARVKDERTKKRAAKRTTAQKVRDETKGLCPQ